MMTPPPAVALLWDRAHELREALLGLRLAVVEDRPLAGGTLVVDRLADEIEAVCSETQAAIDALDQMGAGKGSACSAIADAHRCLQAAASQFWLSFGRHQRQRDLDRSARREGREWTEWTQAVRSAAERVSAPLAAALAALPDAWLSLAPAPSVHVHTTAVGQQLLAVNSPETKETQ
jgi:hypothetical protein